MKLNGKATHRLNAHGSHIKIFRLLMIWFKDLIEITKKKINKKKLIQILSIKRIKLLKKLSQKNKNKK